MIKIIPALLENTFEDIDNKLTTILGVTRRVQIDICDGNYVPSITWPYLSPPHTEKPFNYDESFIQMVGGALEMPHWEAFTFDIDVMAADPIHVLPDLLSIGPDRVIIHFESLENPDEDIFTLANMLPGVVRLGLAVMTTTDLEKVFPYIDQGLVTFVQCMGIAEIGVQGQPFDERVLTQLQRLRTAYPNLPLLVDGGVSEQTINQLITAGATELVSGSYVWTSESPVHALQTLSDTIEA